MRQASRAPPAPPVTLDRETRGRLRTLDLIIGSLGRAYDRLKDEAQTDGVGPYAPGGAASLRTEAAAMVKRILDRDLRFVPMLRSRADALIAMDERRRALMGSQAATRHQPDGDDYLN